MPVIREDGAIAPAPGSAAPQQYGAPGPGAGGAVAPIGGASNDRSLVCVFGDVKRTGRWTVAQTTRSVTVFGDTRLDLREASLEASHVTIRALVLFGDLKIIVPPGVDVQVGGGLVFGDQKVQRRSEVPSTAPRVDVEVYGAFGDVKVWSWSRARWSRSGTTGSAKRAKRGPDGLTQPGVPRARTGADTVGDDPRAAPDRRTIP